MKKKTIRIDPKNPKFIDEISATLLQQGLIDQDALDRAKRAQATSGERFDVVLIQLGLVAESSFTRLIAEHLSMPVLKLSEIDLQQIPDLGISTQFLKKNKIIPISISEDNATVAIADPFNSEALEAFSYFIDKAIDCCVITPADFDKIFELVYQTRQPETSSDDTSLDVNDDDIQRLRDIASEAPTIKLVNQIISNAVEQKASDIHIEPQEDGVQVRYRFDGALQVVQKLPKSDRTAITSRIKIMAKLNIAEQRLPQDGRIKQAVRGYDIDIRVSTIPTQFGESVVLRILDRSTVDLSFSALGFEDKLSGQFQALLQQPNGIILVTGPTGSGKTTTLYTALASLNNRNQKIFTVEDPIEYQLSGINQIQVQPAIGLDFATSLRSILRQDPDIIMIGEIRDLETANIAIQSSLTGHLVFSTLHTNSAAASITRLLDMGVEDYLLASSITGIVAQRLVRCLCPLCAISSGTLPENMRSLIQSFFNNDATFQIDLSGVKSPAGCTECRNTGYSGRTSIVELLRLNDSVGELIHSRATEKEIETEAIAAGMTTMLRHGIEKVLKGKTTMEEVLKVTRMQ